MNKNQEAISVRLLTADLTDWVLKDFINQYKTTLKEVVVCLVPFGERKSWHKVLPYKSAQ